VDERKRESIVNYLRRRMDEFGIEPDDIAASIAEDQLRQRAARYRNASGDTWDGVGEKPQWLVQALSAGQSLEHFSVKNPDELSPVAKGPRVNWADDPFAGSRLATVSSEHLAARP
jgi:DNA-binding protein H-NS